MGGIRNYILTLVVVIFSCAGSVAQDFSYVYIQGDKKTPIYVKFEGEMVPRYGKNYSIISRLAPGAASIEILFQQNVFPPQQFVINVPENGHRGFLLVQKEDAFSLYDLQRQYYIPAGNKAEDDMPKTLLPGEAYVPVNAEEAPKKTASLPKPGSAVKKPATKKPAAKQQPGTAIAKNKEPLGPKFIDDIELSAGKTIIPQSTGEPGGDSFKNAVAVINSDCPKAISNKKFETINARVRERSGTEKLKYLMGEMDNCFTTSQAEALARTLRTDAEKFTFLKNVYPRVTDQSVFPRLERLLSAEEWKTYFKELVSKTE